MKVTSVTIKKSENEGRLLGHADVVVDNALAIHNLKIIQGNDGLFVAFPNTKKVNKEDGNIQYFDIVHPVNSETRKIFVDAILEEFNKN